METGKDGVVVIYRCGNCDKTDIRVNFNDVRDAHMRFEPGDTYTDAECPDCGALAFPEEVPLEQHQHRWSDCEAEVCLKCNAPRLLAQAIVTNKYDPDTDTWTDEEYRFVVEDFDSLCPVSDEDYKIQDQHSA